MTSVAHWFCESGHVREGDLRTGFCVACVRAARCQGPGVARLISALRAAQFPPTYFVLHKHRKRGTKAFAIRYAIPLRGAIPRQVPKDVRAKAIWIRARVMKRRKAEKAGLISIDVSRSRRVVSLAPPRGEA